MGAEGSMSLQCNFVKMEIDSTSTWMGGIQSRIQIILDGDTVLKGARPTLGEKPSLTVMA